MESAEAWEDSAVLCPCVGFFFIISSELKTTAAEFYSRKRVERELVAINTPETRAPAHTHAHIHIHAHAQLRTRTHKDRPIIVPI